MIDIKQMNLPILNNMISKLISEEICSVQPIPDNCSSYFQSSVITEPINYLFGSLVHQFGRGWMVYDGTDFINIDRFINMYGRQSIRRHKKEIYRQLRGIL